MPDTLMSRAPKEALEYLIRRGANLRPSWNWQEVWHEEHAQAFVVAKMTQLDLLQEVHQQLVAAVRDGLSLEEFKKRLVPTLQRQGWWGRKVVDGESVQLGSPERLQVIYDTNLRQAYAAGQWERIQRTKEDLPFLQYNLGPSRQHRVQHAGWAGTILPVDHPWWATHAPMNGWRCKCWLRALTASMAASLGYDPDQPAPAYRMREYTRPDGSVVQVPEGIDPGFAWNPGQAGMRAAKLGQVLGEKLETAGASVGSGLMASAREPLVGALQAAYEPWARDVLDGLVKPQGIRRVVGAMSPQVEQAIESLVGELETSALSVEDRELLHLSRASKAARGAALSREDVLRLPQLLGESVATVWDLEDPALLYVFEAPGDQVGKLVFRVNFQVRARRETLTVNTLRTAGLLPVHDLKGARYQLLEGEL